MTLQDYIKQKAEEDRAFTFWQEGLEVVTMQGYEQQAQMTSEAYAFGDSSVGSRAALDGTHETASYYEAQVNKFFS